MTQNIPFLKQKLVLVGLAAGIALFALCLPRSFREMGSASWPATTGTIMVTNLVHVHATHNDGYLPGVQYMYKVHGRTYVGTRIDFHTQDSVHAKETAESWLYKYPPGRSVRVYYDPMDPRITILEPGIKPEQRWLFYLGMAYIIGLSVAFVVVARDLRRKGIQAKRIQSRPMVKVE
jgi:hypothetical protein